MKLSRKHQRASVKMTSTIVAMFFRINSASASPLASGVRIMSSVKTDNIPASMSSRRSAAYYTKAPRKADAKKPGR